MHLRIEMNIAIVFSDRVNTTRMVVYHSKI